jgi:glycosyltransferase involved in cell wall biosynthesis
MNEECESPSVSVIIPTYNRARCIERAVRSVQNQTFRDFEVLVCDDGSTDATCEVVASSQANDSRIRLLRLAVNQGAGAARNRGMREARGEYIAFLDSDDEWLPEKLARQIERLDREPPSIGICFCGARIIKNGSEARSVIYLPDKEWERDTFRKFVLGRVRFLTPTVLFRRSCLAKTGLMVSEMRRNQDGEFLLRLLAQFGLAVVPECHAIVHIVTCPRRKTVYDGVNGALQYRLQHSEMIRQRLGPWTAMRYRCMHRTNLLSAAIRERRWRDACRDLWYRCREFPLLFPRDIQVLFKATVSGLTPRGNGTAE